MDSRMIIGIIGIGCIGSSLARDIKAKKLGDVHLYDINPDYRARAQELSLGDVYHDDVNALAKACDLVFVCAHIGVIVDIVKSIALHMRPGSIITDVGSVKSSIAKGIQGHLPDDIYFIPGHPITAGTIDVGPDAGREDVFQGASYILTPQPNTPIDALNRLTQILETIGAHLMTMNADKHDMILGLTSHLSHIIAFSMMHSADQLSTQLTERVTDFAGGSFQDLTRVAGSDPQMWRDIFLSNQEHLSTVLDIFSGEINTLKQAIEAQDAEKLLEHIAKASKLRQKAF